MRLQKESKMNVKYDKEYYVKNYDNKFIEGQQKWIGELQGYLSGRGSFRINFIMQFSKYIKGDRILDLGCGVGTFALLFAKNGYRSTGLDISENVVKKCRENATKLDISNVDFLQGDSSADHFKENSFDAIIAADIIEHLPRQVLKNTIDNCYKWLRPGGVFIVHTYPTKYYHLLLGRRIFLLLPLYLLPRNMNDGYLRFVSRFIFDPVWAIRNRITWSRMAAEGGHCNPPHPVLFKEIVNNAGFKVMEYRLIEDILTGLPEDQPRYSWGRKLIKRFEAVRPAILAVMEKPKS